MFRAAVSKAIYCTNRLPRLSQLTLIPTRKTNSMDPDTYVMKSEPLPTVSDFFQNTLSKMLCCDGKEDIIMDVGCGPGQLETQLILPMFPNAKKIIAVDVLPDMIEYAKIHNPHPKVEHHVADINNWATVNQWEGCISQLFAIHSLQWMKNERQALQNVHRILHTNGKATFFFALQADFYDAVQKISSNPKWNSCFKTANIFFPESHVLSHHAPHYEEMLHRLGFSILHMKEGLGVDTFPSDLVYRNFFTSVCVLVPLVPLERREEFTEDLFQYLIKAGGRTSDGLPKHNGNMLEFIIEKK